MNLKGNVFCVLLAGSLAVSTVFPALGAGPGVTEDENRGYDAEVWARLNDNKIEYDELENLIKEFNPNLQSGNLAFQDNIDYMKYAVSDSRGESYKLKQEAEQLKKDGNMMDPGTQAAYMELLVTAGMYQEIGSRLDKSVVSLEKENSSATKQLRDIEKTLTGGAQSLMIAYHTIDAQVGMMEKSLELSSSMYQATLLQQQLGTATQADVLSAESNLLAAQSRLTSLKNNRDSLRQKLGLLTGWSADAAFEIGPIPATDIDWIAGRNQEEDIIKAIGNNSAVTSQRHSRANSSASSDNKQRLEEEAEQKVRIEMQSLYQAMLQSKAAYESAATAYQSAQLSMNAGDRQYQLGMTSKIQYLGQQFTFLQAEGAYKKAEMDLTGAILAYQQGIDGSIKIE